MQRPISAKSGKTAGSFPSALLLLIFLSLFLFQGNAAFSQPMAERIAETITQFGSRVFPELFPNTRGPLERRSTPETQETPETPAGSESSAAGTGEEAEEGAEEAVEEATEDGKQSGAEEQPLAILMKGPERIKGLPFLLPNVLAAYSGHYRWFLPGEGELKTRGSVAVYYTEEEVVPSDSWSPLACGDYDFLLLDPDNVGRLNAVNLQSSTKVSEILYYPGGGEWSLFFAVMPLNGLEGEELSSCGFIVPFLRRFVRFLTISREQGVPPFPALLER